MSVYDTINYIDYSLMGIILILLMGMLCMYRDMVSIKYDKEHWKMIALDIDKARKASESLEVEVDKKLDAMIERIKKKNAE